MSISNRRTIVVHGRLAMREVRLDAARKRRHGLQILSFEQLAVRMAGGLVLPVSPSPVSAASAA
jgi:hypothetical protein